MQENEDYKKRRLLMLRKTLFILSICSFIMIFEFSSQNAQKSTSLSKEVIVKVVDNWRSKDKYLKQYGFLDD